MLMRAHRCIHAGRHKKPTHWQMHHMGDDTLYSISLEYCFPFDLRVKMQHVQSIHISTVQHNELYAVIQLV